MKPKDMTRVGPPAPFEWTEQSFREPTGYGTRIGAVRVAARQTVLEGVWTLGFTYGENAPVHVVAAFHGSDKAMKARAEHIARVFDAGIRVSLAEASDLTALREAWSRATNVGYLPTDVRETLNRILGPPATVLADASVDTTTE